MVCSTNPLDFHQWERAWCAIVSGTTFTNKMTSNRIGFLLQLGGWHPHCWPKPTGCLPTDDKRSTAISPHHSEFVSKTSDTLSASLHCIELGSESRSCNCCCLFLGHPTSQSIVATNTHVSRLQKNDLRRRTAIKLHAHVHCARFVQSRETRTRGNKTVFLVLPCFRLSQFFFKDFDWSS